MARGYGSVAKFAVMRGASGQAWGSGTVPTLGTGHRWPIKSCSIDQARETIADDSLVGDAERQAPTYGNLLVRGAMTFIADYRQAGSLLAALLLGTMGTPVSESGADTGAYTHTSIFGAQSTQEGLWISTGVDWGSADVHQHKYLKLGRWTFSGRQGGYFEDTFEVLGRGIDKTVASSSWTFANSPLGGARAILFRQAVLRINAQTGGALGSSDKVYPVSIAVEVNRNIDQDYAQAAESEEPLPRDFAEVTLRLEFDFVTDTLLALIRDARDAGTRLKADLICTGDDLIVAGGAIYYGRKLYFPNLHVVEAPLNLPGPGPVPFSCVLSAHRAPSVPTGFPTGVDEVLTVVHQNNRSTDYAA